MNIYEIIAEESVTSLKGRVPYQVKQTDAFTLKEDDKIRADIDIIGDTECSLILIGNKELFLKMAEKLHNITLDMDILPSFVGEFWNFVLGPVIKHIKTHGLSIDISPSRPMENTHYEVKTGDLSHYFTIYDEEEECAIGEMAFYLFQKEGE